MARPRKEIDRQQFENLCALQCTRDEICGWFDVTDKTLNSWCKRIYHQSFSAVFAQKRGTGKISLRRHQWRLAEHNANMAIWLGKQYLDQTDNGVLNVTVEEREEDPLSKALREEAERMKDESQIDDRKA